MHVMVIDGLTETEEVLRAVFEPRGMNVTRVSTQSSQVPHSAKRPSVVVVHESDSADATHTASQPNATRWEEVPCVVIGHHHRPLPPASRLCRHLSQPFHYAELVMAIEALTQANSLA